MTTKAQRAILERDEARAELRELLPVGSTVNVIQRHVSRSGMMRHLSLLVGTRDITILAAKAMGEKWHDTGYWVIKVGGCGMDMHFATVYSLSRALYSDGHPCTGADRDSNGVPRCPSNDHNNEWHGSVYSITRIHPDGGYALGHRTL